MSRLTPGDESRYPCSSNQHHHRNRNLWVRICGHGSSCSTIRTRAQHSWWSPTFCRKGLRKNKGLCTGIFKRCCIKKFENREVTDFTTRMKHFGFLWNKDQLHKMFSEKIQMFLDLLNLLKYWLLIQPFNSYNLIHIQIFINMLLKLQCDFCPL